MWKLGALGSCVKALEPGFALAVYPPWEGERVATRRWGNKLDGCFPMGVGMRTIPRWRCEMGGRLMEGGLGEWVCGGVFRGSLRGYLISAEG